MAPWPFAWLDEDDADPKGLEAVLEGRLKVGAVTLNEMRDALGLDPYDTAAADRPMVLTATGYVPIEANAGGERAGAGPARTSGQSLSSETQSGKPALGKASADDPEHPGWPAGTPGGRGGKFRPRDNEGGDAPTIAIAADTPKSKTRYAAQATDIVTDNMESDSTLDLQSSTEKVSEDRALVERSSQIIPVVDFSGGLHGELVDAWMELFKKQGFPAVKELPIRLVGGTDIYGRLDILAKLPICGICALEIKTGDDPTFTENQRLYIPMLLLGGHVYSTDARIAELGLLLDVPFPPMPVFVLWSKPGEVGYRAFRLDPKKEPPK